MSVKFLLTLHFILLIKLISAQTTYTWNGTSSTLWTVPTNWTPNGVPTSTDNVVIVTGSNTCNIVSSRAVNNFTLNSGTLNLATFSFTVNGNTTANTGTISGSAGTIDCEGATSVFGTTASGPIVQPAVIINALTVRLQRTTFNSSVRVTKLYGGSSIDSWRGGNTFNSTFYLDNASFSTVDDVGDIYIGSNAGDPSDVFNGRTTFYVTGCGRIRIPQNGTAVFNGITSFYSNGYGSIHDRIQPARLGNAMVTFNDSTYFYCNSATTDMQIAYDAGTKAIFNGPVIATHYGPSAAAFTFGNDGTVFFNNNVFLNCLGTGAITITNGLGTSTLAIGKTMSVGSVGFSSGKLDIQSLTQLGSTPQTLSVTGTADLNIGRSGKPCIYNANVNFSAPTILLIGSTYNGTTNIFSKTGSGNDESGANTFNGAVILNNSSTADFRFSGTVSGDIFNSTLDIKNTGSGSIRLSRAYNSPYADNITISNTTGGGIFFGANGGISTLASGKTISVGAGGYSNGYLYLYKVSQSSATAQNINLSGAATILRMGDQANITTGCNFPGTFIGSAKGIELTGNTFGSTTTFNQSGPTTTRTWGGNNFGGSHTINVSGAAGIQCSQLFAADSYSSTIDLNLTSSGGITLSRIYNTSFPENITMTGTSTGGIAFGFSGGSSTLASGKTLSVGGTGFTGSFLYLYRFNQLGNTPQSLTLTGSGAELQIGAVSPSTYGSTFGGNLNASAPNFLITSSTFSGSTTFVKTGGDDDDNNGNNTFHGAFTFSNNSPTSGTFIRMSNIFGADTYNGPTTLSSSCNTGGFVMARTFNANFNDNLICNSTGAYIYLGSGNTLTGTATLASGKTITCGTFTAGLLSFRRFNQVSNTSQTITANGSASIEYGGTSTNTNNFSNFEGALTSSTSTGYIAITKSTFQRDATFIAKNYLDVIGNTFNQVSGNTSLSRIAGTTNDDLGGGNTINGNFNFSNTGSGRFTLGVTAYGPDVFNNNVTLTNSGSAIVSLAYNNGANTIAGDLNLISSSTGTIFTGESASANNLTLAGAISSVSGDYTNGSINLRYLTQNGGTNTIAGTSNAVALTLQRTTINGILNISNIGTSSLNTSTFNDQVNTTNSGVTTLLSSAFNGAVTTVNTSTTSIRTCTLIAANNFTSSAFILGGTTAQGSTYNTGANVFTKTGTSNDDVNGGNIFNSAATFNTTNATGRWRLGVTSADDFNSDVTFNQQAAAVLAPTYDANSTFAGNITLSAPTGSAITFASGTGRATLDGGNTQTISKTTGNDPNFNTLTLNKSANSVTLNTRINIITDFTLTAGVLNTTTTNILNMNTGSATSIGNASSYVNGPMNYDMASNATGRRTLNLPVGKSGQWRPSVLQVSHSQTTSYTYKAEVFNADAYALFYANPATIDHVSYMHYWDIDRFNTTTFAAASNTDLRTTAAAGPIVTLYYGTNDGVTDPTNLTICKNTAAASTTWIDIGGAGATITTGNITSTGTPSPFNSFSRFTLGNKIGGTNPLPIELLYFTAKPEGKTVVLDWATASESNNDGFEIERSIDGINFEYLVSVKAHGDGNSFAKQIYNTVDPKPYKGISYYRLKQIDKNTTFKYSEIVSVEFKSSAYVNIFPNPASDLIMISASEDYNNANLKVINNLGVEVILSTQLNSYNGSIDLAHLASGIYYIVIQSGESTENIKISIQK